MNLNLNLLTRRSTRELLAGIKQIATENPISECEGEI